MTEKDANNLYRDTFVPLAIDTNGPFDSFVPAQEGEIKREAVETGRIESGVFATGEVFGDTDEALKQKAHRYGLKKTLEIYKILNEADESQEPTIEARLNLMAAEKEMARAVLVESARKYTRESQMGILTEQNKALYSKTLMDAQEALFPKPDEAVIEYAKSTVMDKVATTNPYVYEHLSDRYPFLAQRTERPQMIDLSPEKRQEWHDYLHEEFDPIFAQVRKKTGELSNENIPDAVNTLLEVLDLPVAQDEDDHEGWLAMKRADVTGFRIEPDKLRVLCGTRSKEITWEIFEQLMMHEIIIHVMRANNGHDYGYEALQNGMPGSQETEEGLGLLIENLWSGADLSSVGRDHFRYLAVCYADGSLDGQMHNETDTYDFVTHLMAGVKPGQTDGTVYQETVNGQRAPGYEHVERVFRGMPQGFVMYSNLSYLSGKLKMIKDLSHSTETPAAKLSYLQSGKFNPLDSTNTELVDEVRASKAA